MISCTDFIPSYSFLFSFLEKNYGVDEVHRYWDHIFDPEYNDILAQEVRANGILGCWNYWTKSLNEEAAEFDMYLNERDGWFSIWMRHCPSKSRLLELQNVVPYHDYCSHCDFYRKTIEKYGLNYDYDFSGVEHAECLMCITDPNKYTGVKKVTPETRVMHRAATDNRYLHRDFHLYLNMGINYLGNRFGEEAVEAYLRDFTASYYATLISRMEKEGLKPLYDKIVESYKAEDAVEVLSADLSESTLSVCVESSPAISYLKLRKQHVSKWFYLTTKTVLETIAKLSGCMFNMNEYDEETGRTSYEFKLDHFPSSVKYRNLKYTI